MVTPSCTDGAIAGPIGIGGGGTEELGFGGLSSIFMVYMLLIGNGAL